MNGANTLSTDVKKYLAYFFETKGFTSGTVRRGVSAKALEAARTLRGSERGPAIMIHGIMPRSGTVYVGELLRLHPDLYSYPHQLWEFPALQLTDGVLKLQHQFLNAYKLNAGKLADEEFLPLFGASLLGYLHTVAPADQRILIKTPSVQYLSHFFSMFAFESLLILVRDGRDLVHSTLRTWPQLNFIQVCLRWNRSARVILDNLEHLRSTGNRWWLARYEDALFEPEQFVRDACHHFELDAGRYPYPQIEQIRVIGSSKLEERHRLSWRHLKKPTNFRPVGYWERWSRAKKSIFKVLAGQSLRQLGYCEDMKW